MVQVMSAVALKVEPEHPRHMIEWIEQPGAIAACGILGCGWIAFYAGSGPGLGKGKDVAARGLADHLKSHHGIKETE
jgi:hypothetical protein